MTTPNRPGPTQRLGVPNRVRSAGSKVSVVTEGVCAAPAGACTTSLRTVGDDDVKLLKLSEVQKLCGIPVNTLRMLIEDDQLIGVARSGSGHAYLREDAVPQWGQIIEILERQRALHLRRAQMAFARVRTELEAVANDLEMAVEEPTLPLGDDLTAFKAYSHRSDQTTLLSAMQRLEETVWRVRSYDEALRQARRAP